MSIYFVYILYFVSAEEQKEEVKEEIIIEEKKGMLQLNISMY